MTKLFLFSLILLFFVTPSVQAQSDSGQKNGAPIVKTANGLIEGITDSETGIQKFLGIPYAQPPVEELRWRPPQPAKSWQGEYKADHFGAKAMQKPVFSDMRFRTDSTSEDCLFLNVWRPAGTSLSQLPVLVYFYGGGFIAGDGSEWRYDGTSLAHEGIVVVTVNYRLGIFGFFTHPALSKESPHHASGNYGLLDQQAAIEWVHKNIAAFGGNPNHITIGGESAGSISVFAQMASPLSRNLIAGAIGESGAMINPTLPAILLSEAEKKGVAFAEMVGVNSLQELRNIPAKQLLEDASKPEAPRFSTTIDGYFFPKSPLAIFETGQQAKVPLLVGWNSAEVPYTALMQGQAPTPENYAAIIKDLFKDKTKEALSLFRGNNEQEVITSATTLASDRFIVYSTWKWAELQRATGNNPVYRYIFNQPRPEAVASSGTSSQTSMSPPLKGAGHSWEIEYALGNLASNKTYAWTPEDYKVSVTMKSYFAHFIKTGNPNGNGLPQWTGNTMGKPVHVMHIQVHSRQKPEEHQKQHVFLDKWYGK